LLSFWNKRTKEYMNQSFKKLEKLERINKKTKVITGVFEEEGDKSPKSNSLISQKRRRNQEQTN